MVKLENKSKLRPLENTVTATLYHYWLTQNVKYYATVLHKTRFVCLLGGVFLFVLF